ncbi:uncharacterized protein TNCV_1737161 [Trichonephila clavipes]|nr:uncharacterized protein TNCV_1737161 [Trichonephila clavipes]
MIRAWCRIEPQTFYQWCCVGSNSGGVLVTIPCVKVMDGAVSAAAYPSEGSPSLGECGFHASEEENGVLGILCPRSSRMEEIGGLGVPLRSLWPTLHCRRVAGVSPLLSIGWWYLSSLSPKRHCCRVSAADKGCRVDPLDPRPDAVVLYSGCTPGKRRAWYMPDDRHTASLVGLRGGWRLARMFSTRIYGSNAAVPG